MNNKELIERLRSGNYQGRDLLFAATALEQADAENAELRAQVAKMQDALGYDWNMLEATQESLHEAQAQAAELVEQVERARQALKRISVPIAFALPRLIDPVRDAELIARMDYAFEALSTLTTGNAVARIEARAPEERAEKYKAEHPEEAAQLDELRKLAEQRQSGSD